MSDEKQAERIERAAMELAHQEDGEGDSRDFVWRSLTDPFRAEYRKRALAILGAADFGP